MTYQINITKFPTLRRGFEPVNPPLKYDSVEMRSSIIVRPEVRSLSKRDLQSLDFTVNKQNDTSVVFHSKAS